MGRILTLNCHEAWVHQLGLLGEPFDVVDGLPGRPVARWDERVRPVPRGARLLSLEEARDSPEPWTCVIVHSPQDLVDVRTIRAPKVLVLHVHLAHRARQDHLHAPPAGYLESVHAFVRGARAHVVAVSRRKAESWGFPDAPLVPFAIDPASRRPWTGEVACGLRVASQITAKRATLLWDFHERAFGGLPVRIVGLNPDMPGIEPSRSFDDLRDLLARHRFWVHTADPALEDGHNMATAEAMAAGLPVLGNRHPTSPIEHGVSGWLSDDPEELAAHARALLADRELARGLGEAARRRAAELFAPFRFVAAIRGAVADAAQAFGLPPPPIGI